MPLYIGGGRGTSVTLASTDYGSRSLVTPTGIQYLSQDLWDGLNKNDAPRRIMDSKA